jgi:hypothetical protein
MNNYFEIKTLKDWNSFVKEFPIEHLQDGFKPFCLVKTTKEQAKTNAQNKLFHALLREFANDCASETFEDLKKRIKKQVGLVAGTVYFYYKGGEKVETVIKSKNDKTKIDDGYIKAVQYPDSWAMATLKQGRQAIDILLKEIYLSGCNTPKMQEILKGIENNNF